eukprot:jgi/Galph1/4677/GphlegSOOS_G3329.1
MTTAYQSRSKNFTFTGTPFDEEQVPPKLSQSQRVAPTIEYFQQVRDENGLQRLHGAFKGGFSAGYFNSVGSKEGWTPSSFYSSRSSRAKKQTSNGLESLIDEEDIEDDDPVFSIGGVAMDVKPTFRCLSSRADQLQHKQRKYNRTEQASENFLPEDYLHVSTEALSLGFQILRKLGWRDTRVVGEEGNVKNTPMVKVYGPQLPSKEKNTPIVQVALSKSENDTSGLDYNSGDYLQLKQDRRSEMKAGLLNQTQSVSYLEEDEDEFDIFDTEREEYLETIQDGTEKLSAREKRGSEKEIMKKQSTRDELLSNVVKFQLASEKKERTVYTAPTIPKGYDLQYDSAKDKYSISGNMAIAKRLFSSVKSVVDRRILLGESLINIREPKKRQDVEKNKQQQSETSPASLTMISPEVLKKLNNAMSERFTAGNVTDLPESSGSERPPEILRNEKHDEGLVVGNSNRQIRFWQPSRLLCKRFNITQPVVTGESTARTSSRIYTELPFIQPQYSETNRSTTSRNSNSLGEDETKDDERDENVLSNSDILPLRSDRPSTELFHAIFEEDSDEEKEEWTLGASEDSQSLLYTKPDANKEDKDVSATRKRKEKPVDHASSSRRARAVDYF